MSRDDSFLFFNRSYKYCLFNDRVSNYRIDYAWLAQSRKQSAIKITMPDCIPVFASARVDLEEKSENKLREIQEFPFIHVREGACWSSWWRKHKVLEKFRTQFYWHYLINSQRSFKPTFRIRIKLNNNRILIYIIEIKIREINESFWQVVHSRA